MENTHMRKVPSLAFAALTFVAFSLCPCAWPQAAAPENTETWIRFRLNPTKRIFKQGERIPVHIELSNVGFGGILVCNEIILGPGLPCYVHLWLEDEKSRKIAEPNFVIDRFPPNSKETLLQALLRIWSNLQPEHTLKATVEFYPPGEHDLKPGHYLLRGSYLSSGIDAPYFINSDLLTSEELSKIPYPAFHGRVDADPVRIEITPNSR
jgi:hypothetical protein